MDPIECPPTTIGPAGLRHECLGLTDRLGQQVGPGDRLSRFGAAASVGGGVGGGHAKVVQPRLVMQPLNEG